MNINSETIPLLTHDLKGPVGNIAMFSQLISSGLEQLQIELGETNDISALRWQVDYINSMAQKYVDQLQNWADLVFLLDGKAHFDLEPVLLHQLIDEVIESNELFWNKKQIQVHVEKQMPALVQAEKDVIRRILDNLFQVVILLSSPNTQIEVKLIQTKGEQIELSMSGLKVQDLHLFEELFLKDLKEGVELEFTKGIIKTTGVGLAFCGLAIRAFGGKPMCITTDSGLNIGCSLPVLVR